MKPYNTIGEAEILAVRNLIKYEHPLSGYLGGKEQGGVYVSQLEDLWTSTFGCGESIACNSATSGLLAACMAAGIGPGDEVIVPPYTMSATAAAPKVLGAKIVFADIEPETFSIDPVEASNLITGRTKAVIVTNLFGHPANLHELRDICHARGVVLIEDNAQSIFAKENGVYAGAIGDIGVFSLNVHKHLQTGEGGIITTRSHDLAKRLRGAANHGEMRGLEAGLNLRMTEYTAVMAMEQLKKAPEIMKGRLELAKKLSKAWGHGPIVRGGCNHVYYDWTVLLHGFPEELPEPWHRPHQLFLPNYPAFADAKRPLPVAEDVDRRLVCFNNCSFDPTDAQIVEIVSKLKASFNENRWSNHRPGYGSIYCS
jgi:dTDP-4-amino-4,6-dideoxygalactose transaminase